MLLPIEQIKKEIKKAKKMNEEIEGDVKGAFETVENLKSRRVKLADAEIPVATGLKETVVA